MILTAHLKLRHVLAHSLIHRQGNAYSSQNAPVLCSEISEMLCIELHFREFDPTSPALAIKACISIKYIQKCTDLVSGVRLDTVRVMQHANSLIGLHRFITTICL